MCEVAGTALRLATAPLLESWNAKTDPAQIRLAAYLDQVAGLVSLPCTGTHPALEMCWPSSGTSVGDRWRRLGQLPVPDRPAPWREPLQFCVWHHGPQTGLHDRHHTLPPRRRSTAPEHESTDAGIDLQQELEGTGQRRLRSRLPRHAAQSRRRPTRRRHRVSSQRTTQLVHPVETRH